MPELTFTIEGARPIPGAAPAIGFRLRVCTADATEIHSVALRCQVRILPARRRYTGAEQEKLLALFGTPDRWGKTVRDLHWATVGVTVPAFVGTVAVELAVPCARDPSSATTRYFDALDGGDAELLFLFSGTVFYEAAGVGPQVCLIPWDREARFRLTVGVWNDLFAAESSPLAPRAVAGAVGGGNGPP